jgi:hypothetical protein
MIKRSFFLVGAALALYGCSSDSTTSTPVGPAADGGPTGNTNTVKLTGQMVDYSTGTGEAGWEVEAAGVKATTTAKGTYELSIPKDTPFNFTVTDPTGAHFTLVDQEAMISADFDKGKLRFVPKQVGDILLGALQADKTKGVISVAFDPLDTCTAKASDFPQGAKLTTDQADAKIVYYKGTPDPSLTEAQAGQDPAAVVFNAAPDTSIGFTATSKCTQKAFPYTDGAITYTGKISPKGNSTLSVYRIFFE